MNTESRDGAMSELDLGMLGDIERIEVLRGPAGLTYGSGAIAGVVNVVTKEFHEDAFKATTSVQTWDGKTLAQQVEVQGNKKIGNDLNIGVASGYRTSQGPAAEQNRIYGRPSWPYPGTTTDIPQNGVPTAGSAGSTPGNYKAAVTATYKEFKVYSRYTHQVTNASGYFIVDPWPNDPNPLPATAGEKMVDGVMRDRNSFYGNVEAYNTNRRQYLINNWTTQLSHKINFNKNYLKLDAGMDMVTNRIQTQPANQIGFHNVYGANNDKSTMIIAETFGEKRYSGRGVFVVNSIKRLQLAMGYQFRLFQFGKDMDGWNMQNEKPNHIIVSNTNYVNNALFAEGMYEVHKKLNVNFGARYDVHTRTASQGGVFNPKLAVVYKLNDKNSLKLIYQTSANNGSADNYDYGRNSVTDDGTPNDKPRFEKATDRPGANSIVLAPVTTAQLHSLKPERTQSIELATVHEVMPNFFLLSSASYNNIRNLFVWNQSLFRVMNGGTYNFINLDLEVKYATEKWKIGANHTHQNMVNTDINQKASFDLPNNNGYDSTVSASGTTYSPIVNSYSTNNLTPVKDGISNDGYNFVNLATDVSKLYIDYSPSKKFGIHTNMRVFWNLKGRQYIQNENPGYNYLGVHNNAIVKWNVGLHFRPTENVTLSLFGYDLLGTKNNPINALRWGQMFQVGNTELYTADLRSFAFRIDYKF